MNEREQIWREWVEWQEQSGLTVAECSREAGVSVSSFYRWKRLLNQPGNGSSSSREHQPAASRSVENAGTSQFMPIEFPRAATSRDVTLSNPEVSLSSLRITLPNGVVFDVADNVSSEWLGEIIREAGLLQYEVRPC